MKQARTAILISGRGSNMKALIEAAQRPDHAAEIVTVVSNRPDARGLETASAHGVEAVSIDHRTFEAREDFEAELDRHCRRRGVDLIACAGFMRILTGSFIDRWRGRILNIHPSLLPSYPGLDTHQRVLQEGVRIHGCTVHFMDNAVDQGPIIAQAAVPVFTDDSIQSLAERVLGQEHRLYPLALGWVASGAAKLDGNRVTYSLGIERDYRALVAPTMKNIRE
jgi:phosphoribosylglycinamide formyltransferase 1